MKRPLLKLPPKAKPKTTAQQARDFTAEGAPPPGMVGTAAPVDAAEQAHADYEQARQDQAARE
jgi:hypothetical protein